MPEVGLAIGQLPTWLTMECLRMAMGHVDGFDSPIHITFCDDYLGVMADMTMRDSKASIGPVLAFDLSWSALLACQTYEDYIHLAEAGLRLALQLQRPDYVWHVEPKWWREQQEKERVDLQSSDQVPHTVTTR